MLYQLSYFRISSYLSGHLLRWTSYRQSVIYSSKLPLSSLVRLESDRPYTPVFSSGRLLRWTSPELWEKMDSNHRRYKPADLQSAPFGHSGILPFFLFLFRDDFVILRVVGQSFTQVNSFPPHSTSLPSQKINFKIFVSFSR